MEIFQEYSLASLSFTLGYCLFGRGNSPEQSYAVMWGAGNVTVGSVCHRRGLGSVLLLDGTKVTKSWAPAAHPAWVSCPRHPEGSAFILLKTRFHLWLCPHSAISARGARAPSTEDAPN